MKIPRISLVASAIISMGVLLGLVFMPTTVKSHCDTMAGPVITDAKEALESGDITPVLKWVKEDDEPEIMTAFRMARTVRVQSPEARELADKYFFETLVRVHRAGEGAPYTGLKPAEAIEPITVLSDHALESGDLEELVHHVSQKVAQGIRDRFQRTLEARSHASDNVEAGREYVEAYVLFTHYVEKLHADAISQAGNSEEQEHGH